jgi:hypothetical protein
VEVTLPRGSCGGMTIRRPSPLACLLSRKGPEWDCDCDCDRDWDWDWNWDGVVDDFAEVEAEDEGARESSGAEPERARGGGGRNTAE